MNTFFAKGIHTTERVRENSERERKNGGLKVFIQPANIGLGLGFARCVFGENKKLESLMVEEAGFEPANP